MVTDKGVENVNDVVDGSLDFSQLTRILAQVEVSFPNSMIESFWRKIKYSFLFKYNRDSLATVKRLIAKFIDEYNTVMPHSAFRGQMRHNRVVFVNEQHGYAAFGVQRPNARRDVFWYFT